MPAEEEVLRDEPGARVVRVGDTVRRRAGPWTSSVHAMLRHLEDVGFDGAPRVLGFDDEGREVLSYLPSERVWPFSEHVLVETARLVRRLHDALATFVPPEGAVWHDVGPEVGPEPGSPSFGHNDIGPMNTAFRDGAPYGFIDWELAGPAPPLFDLAWAALNFTPLRPDRFCAMVGFDEPPDRGRRFRRFCEAYGLDDAGALLDATETYERDALYRLVELGGAGISPHARYLARGEDTYLRWDLDWLVANRDQLRASIS